MAAYEKTLMAQTRPVESRTRNSTVIIHPSRTDRRRDTLLAP